jgi:hypothetical protein
MITSPRIDYWSRHSLEPDLTVDRRRTELVVLPGARDVFKNNAVRPDVLHPAGALLDNAIDPTEHASRLATKSEHLDIEGQPRFRFRVSSVLTISALLLTRTVSPGRKCR